MIVSDLRHVGVFFSELRFPPPIKLTVAKQTKCNGFISTVAQANLPTSTLNTKYMLSKLHDSATYDDRIISYEWLKHQALKCNFVSLKVVGENIVFCVVFCRSMFVLFRLAIVLPAFGDLQTLLALFLKEKRVCNFT